MQCFEKTPTNEGERKERKVWVAKEVPGIFRFRSLSLSLSYTFR